MMTFVGAMIVSTKENHGHFWIVAGVTDVRRGFVGLSGMVKTPPAFAIVMPQRWNR